ncbi:MAG: phage/plasmid primase, P4 family [Terrimicrobiaceae bacterium]
MTLELDGPSILSRLNGVKKTLNGWEAQCPAHDDNHASLSIAMTDDGKTLLKCQAGCDTATITKAVDMGMKDLFPSKESTKSIGKIVAEYNYHDEHGTILFQCVRYHPKTFRQRQPDRNGGWIWDLKGVRLVLYRLPELLASKELVFIVEGEKDADNLTRLGLVGTCNPMGAGKWRKDYTHFFKNRRVFIIPDKDEPGRKHANAVNAALSAVAESVLVLELPGAGKDFSDWVANGGTRQQLLEMTETLEKLSADSPESVIPLVPDERLPKNMEDLYRIYNPARDTDGGNSERLLTRIKDKIRFTREMGWLIWDGQKWVADDTAIKNLAKKTVLETIIDQIGEATKAQNPALIQDLAKWWKRSDNDQRTAGALAMIEGEPEIYVKKANFDKDQMQLNVQNGIIDLRTGELKPHAPEALMTRISPIVYDHSADCPTFKGFLNQIMRGSQDLIRFLQKAIGYTLTGVVKEQCWFFLYGRGHNGKSTLIDVISKLLGEYTGKTGIETFLPKFQQQAGNTPEIAALDGARFVYASETEEGKSLAAGRIKDMTGGEQISAMPKYRDPYNFYPVWKIWISGNHKPTIKDTTISTWRRIRMIPFSVQIPEQEQDQDLPVKLERELSGILKWAVEGCLAWQKEGLKPSKEITDATKAYQNSQDILGKFIEECCIVSPRMIATAKNLYESYCKWSEENGERFPKTQRVFGEALTERGFDRRRGAHGVGIWAGIGLLHLDDLGDRSDPCDPNL